MTENFHVIRDGDGWAVKREGSPFPLSRHATQSAAVRAAKPLAQMFGAELVTHRTNGDVRDKDSFGNDPFPPRDRRHGSINGDLRSTPVHDKPATRRS